MEEIFKNIEGRDWDWFGQPVEKVKNNSVSRYNFYTKSMLVEGRGLADLLSNKSFCIVVWGDEEIIKKIKRKVPQQQLKSSIYGSVVRASHEKKFKMKIEWKKCSTKAFQILQQQGEEEAIEYIKKTMIC
jgi:hypothetical protein